MLHLLLGREMSSELIPSFLWGSPKGYLLFISNSGQAVSRVRQGIEEKVTGGFGCCI